MMTKFLFLTILGSFFLLEAKAFENTTVPFSSRDSVGVITKKGKRYIQYRVEDDEETIEELSQEYAAPIYTILEANPQLVKNGQKLQVGAIINVPISENIGYYRIMPGDNLFRIARKTGMSIDQLKKINNINNQYITAGRLLLIEKNPHKKPDNKTVILADTAKWNNSNIAAIDTLKNHLPLTKEKVKVPIIHIVQRGEGLFKISQQYKVSIESLEKMNNFNRNSWLEPNRKFIVGYRSVMPPNGQNPNTANGTNPNLKNKLLANKIIDTLKTVKNIKKTVSELPTNVRKKGIGAKVKANNRDNNTQKIAFHRTATLGSFMRVTNPSNGRGTVVRVIGRIPNTDKDRNVIIKISKATCTILGLVNDRFPIEIEYNQ